MSKIAISILLLVFFVLLKVSGELDPRDLSSVLQDPVVLRALRTINTELLRRNRDLSGLTGCVESAVAKYKEESVRSASASSTDKADPSSPATRSTRRAILGNSPNTAPATSSEKSPLKAAAVNGSLCVLKVAEEKALDVAKDYVVKDVFLRFGK